MSTDCLFTTLPTWYKKAIALLLSLFFSFALAGIALDQHFLGFSKSCLICRTKSSINGLEPSFSLDLFPKIIYYFLDQLPIKITILVLLTLNNKAPPPISLR